MSTYVRTCCVLDGGSANNLASYGSGNEETLKTKSFRMIKQNAVEPTGNYVYDNEDQDPQVCLIRLLVIPFHDFV